MFSSLLRSSRHCSCCVNYSFLKTRPNQYISVLMDVYSVEHIMCFLLYPISFSVVVLSVVKSNEFIDSLCTCKYMHCV